MLTGHAITQRADADGVGTAVVERDYYSADLDFTVMEGTTASAVAAIADALAAARRHVGFPHLELSDADAPAIDYIGPLGAGKPRHIKLDVTADELVESVEQRVIRDVWPDLPAPVAFGVYPTDEIGAEKLRCIIQRVLCRDLYDIFRLAEHMNVSLAEIWPLFERKTRAKGLDPTSFRDRFENRVERYNRRWSVEMGEHLADPPHLDNVVRVVRRHLRAAGLLEA